MKKLTEEWLRAAKDDLDVIEKILNDRHLTHIVAFHAQQCIEKVFKSLLEEHEVQSQKIHNLVALYGMVENWLNEPLDIQMLTILDALYTEARYPGELGLLPNGRPTIDDAKRFYAFARAVYEKTAY